MTGLVIFLLYDSQVNNCFKYRINLFLVYFFFNPSHDEADDKVGLVGVKGWSFSMEYHLFRQPRQQVAVACWAIKTGCPRMGVCLPSFCG